MPLPGTLASSTSSGSGTFSVVRMSLPTFVQTRHCAALPISLNLRLAVPRPCLTHTEERCRSPEPRGDAFLDDVRGGGVAYRVPMPPRGARADDDVGDAEGCAAAGEWLVLPWLPWPSRFEISCLVAAIKLVVLRAGLPKVLARDAMAAKNVLPV